MFKSISLFCLGAFLLAACQPAAPVRQFTKGDELAFYDFSQSGTFEEATYGDGTVRLQISGGKYRVELLEGDSEVWYGQWGDTLRDVVIDVEAKQFTEDENTTYGVMCRARGAVGQQAASDPTLDALASEGGAVGALVASADATAEATEAATSEAEVTAEATETADATEEAEATAEATELAEAEATAEATAVLETGGATILNVNNGDGYLFLVQGNGRWSIMRSRGRSVTALVDWTDSSVINRGPAENRIRAVCVGDYLALYINGQFVGDATDDTYSQGQIGFAAASATRLGLLVEFDNLSVSEASAS